MCDGDSQDKVFACPLLTQDRRCGEKVSLQLKVKKAGELCQLRKFDNVVPSDCKRKSW